MKRFFIVLAVISMAGVNMMHAQEMQRGMSLIQAGLGVIPGFGVNASWDYGLIDKWGPGIFTVGGYVGYGLWAYSKNFNGSGKNLHVNAIVIAPRVTYRYAINSTFEVYGAVMSGTISGLEKTNADNTSTRLYSAVTAGCRYTFARNFSVFAEAGYNEISYLNGGLCISF